MGEEREGHERAGTIKMTCLVATTEVSYLKGIESIVFHQLIFQVFIGTDPD